MNIKVYLSIGYVPPRRDELEIDDEATDEQIEEMVSQWASDYIEWGWEKAEDEEEL